LSILQRYLYREWSLTLVAVTIVLFIVLMGVFLGELLNDLADGKTPPGLLGLQLLLHTPEALSSILPLAGFVAVMWGLGRLYRDQEMAVMRSSGFGWRQMLRPLALLVLPAAALLFVITFSIAPRSAALADQKLEEAFRSAVIWGLQEGRFHILQDGDLVIYVESLGDDGRSLENIFIQQREERREIVWMARTGEYWMDTTTGQRYLTLMDGQVTDIVPNQLDMRVLEFERTDFRLPEPERRSSDEKLETQSTADLLSAADVVSFAELQWRLAPPILIIVLGLLAIPLSHSNPREGRGIRVVLGILSYALYANTLYLCRAWMAEGLLPASVGMWWAHGLVFLFALLWLGRQGRMVGYG
jgi:lipopolysaccharide export system permease protein